MQFHFVGQWLIASNYGYQSNAGLVLVFNAKLLYTIIASNEGLKLTYGVGLRNIQNQIILKLQNFTS